MKIVLVYIIFCLILLYVYWHYAKLNHLEKVKQTKIMANYFSDNSVIGYATKEPEKSVINIKKAKKYTTKKKK